MELLKTIKTNWRDIVVGLALVIGLALLADFIERLSISDDGTVWLANTVSFLNGLATFAGANLAAWFMLAVAWPTLNNYSNDQFTTGWDSLTKPQRFATFVSVACVLILAASLCFG